MKDMLLLLVIILFGLSTTVHAQTPTPPPGMPASPAPPPAPDRHTFRASPVEPVSPGVYRIGDILINKAEKSVSFPARINMDKGLLEYVLVRTGGKTHESLFRTETEPYDLQLACLLLDLVGTDKPLPFQGAQDLPKGDLVSISVSRQDKEGKGRELRPETWITKTVEGKPQDVEPLKWVFVGSMINEGRFLAQVEGSIISLYHDPIAIIDNASPGGESDKIWFVNEQNVPPVGTPVTITIKAKK